MVRIVEDFHVPPCSELVEYLEKGWIVYNAPRPLAGHATWQGQFRHGIFYAAVAPAGDPVDEFDDHDRYTETNRRLDGWPCVLVSRNEIMDYGARIAKEYDLDVADLDYDDIVVSFLG